MTASAQFATEMPLVAGDTVTNAASLSKELVFTGAYSGIVIQPVVTRLTGSPGGKVYLSQSLDGTNYTKIDSVSIASSGVSTALFKVTAPTAVHFKITVSQTGTATSQLRLWYVARKYQTVP